MTTATDTRLADVAKYEARARALLAAGFTTKSAQKDAKEHASRAYSQARDMVLSVYLAIPREERTPEQESVYDVLPYETHNFRPKHADAIAKGLPGAMEFVPVIERTVALYAEIKAAPVTPKPPKVFNDGGLPIHLSDAYNPALKEQFLAQAPEIKAEYIADVRRAAALMEKTFGAAVPARISEKEAKAQGLSVFFMADHNLFAHHCDVVKPSERDSKTWTLKLDEACVEAKAERFSILVALQWFYKVNGKLGELAEATLHRDQGGFVVVSGTKADGSKVTMRQQRIMKWAPVACEYFHQFPSHLYVDGKYHTALEYSKRFADSSAEE